MASTTNLSITKLEEGQLNVHITINEALQVFDAVWPRIAQDETNTPASHSDGKAWIVGDTPTGDWASNAEDIALSLNGSWYFISPPEGTRFYDTTANVFKLWDGSDWVTTGVGYSAGSASDVGALGTQVSGTDQAPNTDSITDPSDSPADADALRDDLVANAIPEIRNNFRTLVEWANDLRSNLRSAGLMD